MLAELVLTLCFLIYNKYYALHKAIYVMPSELVLILYCTHILLYELILIPIYALCQYNYYAL